MSLISDPVAMLSLQEGNAYEIEVKSMKTQTRSAFSEQVFN